MAIPTDQLQMESKITSDMRELFAAIPDSVYGMLHPRLVACNFNSRTLEVIVMTTAWMRNINQVVHGGVIATALDNIGGLLACCFSTSGMVAPTVSLQISYQHAIPIDAELHVRAYLVHNGQHLIHVRTEAFILSDGEERMCASGAAVHYNVPAERI
ncbi:MAG: PaaI family thioesterase [Clostridia bacterium]